MTTREHAPLPDLEQRDGRASRTTALHVAIIRYFCFCPRKTPTNSTLVRDEKRNAADE